jgi:hypothetical protein
MTDIPPPPSKLPLLIIIGFAVAGAAVTAVPFSLGWRRARKRREAKTGRAVFFDASGSAGHPRNSGSIVARCCASRRRSWDMFRALPGAGKQSSRDVLSLSRLTFDALNQ